MKIRDKDDKPPLWVIEPYAQRVNILKKAQEHINELQVKLDKAIDRMKRHAEHCGNSDLIQQCLEEIT